MQAIYDLARYAMYLKTEFSRVQELTGKCFLGLCFRQNIIPDMNVSNGRRPKPTQLRLSRDLGKHQYGRGLNNNVYLGPSGRSK